MQIWRFDIMSNEWDFLGNIVFVYIAQALFRLTEQCSAVSNGFKFNETWIHN